MLHNALSMLQQRAMHSVGWQINGAKRLSLGNQTGGEYGDLGIIARHSFVGLVKASMRCHSRRATLLTEQKHLSCMVMSFRPRYPDQQAHRDGI